MNIIWVMKKNTEKHITPVRLKQLPETFQDNLKRARIKRGWSQASLGRQSGFPQAHISGIETGKIVPRFDTLLDLVRVLGQDLLMVPRELLPAVQALIRNYQYQAETGRNEETHSLYAIGGEDEAEEQEHHHEI